MQQPSGGSLLPLEFAKGEPATGGLDFDTAIREWVSEDEWRNHRSEIKAGGGFAWLLMVHDSTEAHIERECRSEVFNKKWARREVVCFGFPLHKKRQGQRELISAELREALRFGGCGPGPKVAGFACDPEWEDTDHRRGVAYSNVRFYWVADHPPLVAVPDRVDRTQTAKARLRATVKKILEQEAAAETERMARDPNELPLESTKAGWLRRVRAQLGADGDKVTKTLFDVVWKTAAIREAWRTPGAR